MTIDEAVDLMRALPGCLQTMWAVADVWEENEAFVECVACDGRGWHRNDPDPYAKSYKCKTCNGSRLVSNGNSARAEALRLLAECGKTGGSDEGSESLGHWSYRVEVKSWVPRDWLQEALVVMTRNGETVTRVGERVRMMDAYAKASPETRRAWAEATRKLTGRTATPAG